MTKTSSRSHPLFCVVALIVILADQASKLWIASHFDLYEVEPVIEGFFNLVHITNTGAAFGLLAGADSWRHVFFLVINTIALVGLAWLYLASPAKSRFLLWGCSLVFGGAVGNLIDRIRLGSVIDFLDFYVSSYHWPAFNVADSAICVGSGLLAFHFLRFSPHPKKN